MIYRTATIETTKWRISYRHIIGHTSLNTDFDGTIEEAEAEARRLYGTPKSADESISIDPLNNFIESRPQMMTENEELGHLWEGLDDKYIRTRFYEGKKYQMSWIGDSELKTNYIVIKRTKHTAWLKQENRPNDELIQCRIGLHDQSEIVYPTGKYSMAPSLRASKEIAS